MELLAKVVVMEKNIKENYCMVAFSDHKKIPMNYLIIQKTIEENKDDALWGLSGYYLEISSPQTSGYNICEKVSLEEKKLVFFLKKNMELRNFTIDLSSSNVDHRRLRYFLNQILNGIFVPDLIKAKKLRSIRSQET